MNDRFKSLITIFVGGVLIFAVGCGTDPASMGLPYDPDNPTAQQGQKGDPGPQGPKGEPGEQGPPGASPFELIGNDAVYTQGNVGIGTDSPTEALHVEGETLVSGTVFAGAFSSHSPLLLQTNGSTRIHVDDVSGHVGIGTSSPTEMLHVEGSAYVADTLYASAIVSENAPLELKIDGTTRLFVADNSVARIGVGTDMTDPKAELDVRGGIRTTTFSGGSRNSLEIRASGTVADLTYSQSVGNTSTVSTKVRFDLQTTRFFGSVGLGRDPSANRLEVEGNASKSSAGDWLANSDARIKTNVETVTNALETLDRVRLVRFRYTDDYRETHPGIVDRPYLNVIAQEFREVFPEHVQGSGERLPDGSEILQVDTYPLTIYSAAAIQELSRHMKAREGVITCLESRCSSQQAQIQKLEERLAELEQRMSTMAAAPKTAD